MFLEAFVVAALRAEYMMRMMGDDGANSTGDSLFICTSSFVSSSLLMIYYSWLTSKYLTKVGSGVKKKVYWLGSHG